MQPKRKPQKWIIAAITGLALAASSSLSTAADITYSFDADAQGWYAADGHGTVVWDNTVGRGGLGCLKCTIVSDGTTGDTEIDPRVDVAYNTLGYFSVEYDMMVDAASGTDAAGSYGNLQMVDWDAGWNWHSQWYGSLGGPTGKFTNWVHVTQSFTATYGDRVRLQFQIAASAAPYSTNVIIYIDNVVIRDGTPPTKAVLYDFTWPETCKPGNTWGGGGAGASSVFSQDTTIGTNGCMKQVATYGPTNVWQDVPSELQGPAFDPTKFTYFDFDLYLDAPTGLSSYGSYAVRYWWSWATIGSVSLSEANIGKWTHYSFPLPAGTANGIVLQPGGGNLSNQVFTYYLDNVTMWRPAEPPSIKKIVKATGASGVQITMDANGQQWQREAIVTPSGGGPYFWASQGAYPVSYSFTITNFPDAATHGGFEAHMYIVNADTTDGQTGWNSTYGGVDWNVPDILRFSVENNAAGGAIARVNWKTNLPGANPPAGELNNPVEANGPTVLGTWTLTFSDATSGTVTGPGGVLTNFTLPAEAVANNFSPLTDYIQFGMFKNDGANDGHNDQVSGTFSRVQLVSIGWGAFDDSFPGPDLQGSGISWRKTTSSGGATAVQYVPPDIAWWVTWSTPDDGFQAWGASAVNVPFVDAGVGAGMGYSYTQGATRIGAVPAANVPAGNAAFFQLRKPVP